MVLEHHFMQGINLFYDEKLKHLHISSYFKKILFAYLTDLNIFKLFKFNSILYT